ncbi:hypothetical protein [Teredinibacter franksiae]|uniref:hypothetical protein n=1 Tax=Teredinibacter franksiae TaxID=2761453 RepID=UPI0016241B89|nr:hypothetical protein [Teredinibacter franksiae]
MMRRLAEFVMRGRIQAIVIASLGVLSPLFILLTLPTIGLVTLRKGWQQGAIVTLGPVATGAALAALLGVDALALYVNLGAIFVVSLIALVLRQTGSWPAALAALVALCILAVLVPSVIGFDPSVIVQEQLKLVLEAQPQEGREELEKLFSGMTEQMVGGAMALPIAFCALFGMLIARWWQAMLFNPGGFKEELQGLRLPPVLASACVVAFAFCEWRGESYVVWQGLVVLPLLVAGLGLFHWIANKKNWGVGPLVIVYITLLFPPIWFAVIVLGLTDVWIDYRKRFNLMQQ